MFDLKQYSRAGKKNNESDNFIPKIKLGSFNFQRKESVRWLRRGSRINTDPFPKRGPKKQASRGPGAYFRAIFWRISTPKGLLSHSDRVFTVCQNHLKDFNLEFFSLIWNIFIIKNLTDFRKTAETGVDPSLWLIVNLAVLG